MNPTLPPKEWPLQQLADKMKQYCYLLSDLEPELLAQEAKGDYETLRDYLRERGVEAYWQKVLTALNPLGSILAVRIQKACRESGSTSGCSFYNGRKSMEVLLKQLSRDWLQSSIDHALSLLSLGMALYDVVTLRQVEEVEAVEKGLATDAQRFFVLTQTDNMWKEHLQVTCSLQENLCCKYLPS